MKLNCLLGDASSDNSEVVRFNDYQVLSFRHISFDLVVLILVFKCKLQIFE